MSVLHAAAAAPAARSAGGWLLPLLSRRLLVFCGSGGVGKTTASAAVGVEAAVRGRRVLVMTIDPARRLAESLGLSELGNEETPIDLERRLPGERVQGSLHALMLDPAAAFHDLLERIARSPEEAERVRGNRLFRLMLNQMAGVQEYLAGEKVYDAVQSGRYDLVVLDTPPTRNALDFLDSPGRIAHMLDERIVRWFLPGADAADPPASQRLLRRLLKTSGNVVKRVLGRVFGMELMDEVESFFVAMAGLRAEFRRRSEEVRRLMSSPQTSFVLVTSTSEVGRREAVYFHQEIVQRKLPFAGFVVNRIHLPVASDGAWPEQREALQQQVRELLRQAVPGQAPPLEETELEGLVAALQQNVHDVNRLAAQDSERVRKLLADAGCDVPPLLVPLLPEEAYDLAGLRQVAAYLV